MKRVVVFGSGKVARPAIRALLDAGHEVQVATDQPEAAKAMLDGHPHGRVTGVDASDDRDVATHVRGADLAISLLPVRFHPRVAQACVDAGTHFVTTSYVSRAMRALHEPAKAAGLLLLNEIGADPGIDHMQAMRMLDRLRRDGAEITGVYSVCGGLPAPEANTNPLGYKISWSTRGVALAGRRPARHLRDGTIVECAPYEIFQRPRNIHLEGLGDFEAYPNGDSLRFLEEYGLGEIERMFRGTLRFAGWCETWAALAALGQLEERPVTASTYAEAFRELVHATEGESARIAAARHLGMPNEHAVLDRLEWLGLFDPRPIELEKPTSLDLLVARMDDRLAFAEGERDMLVLYHEIDYRDRTGAPRRTRATMVEYGRPGGDTAMARTVGLPAAFAATRILDGSIRLRGVRIPTSPQIYAPVLEDLEAAGIGETQADSPRAP